MADGILRNINDRSNFLVGSVVRQQKIDSTNNPPFNDMVISKIFHEKTDETFTCIRGNPNNLKFVLVRPYVMVTKYTSVPFVAYETITVPFSSLKDNFVLVLTERENNHEYVI